MKFLYLLVICALSMAMALPQYKPYQPDPRLPKITTSGGGSPKQGNLNFDVRQQIWQSQNKRHSLDGTGGYSRNWGQPNPVNNQKDYRVGVGYTLKLN